jgi:cytoskeletal protein CcmA (bactofilin family)
MSDIKVRVGQQNAVKVISSISGSAGGRAVTAENVIGGIGSIRELHVSGISTFVGVSTFKNDVYIDGDLYINDDLRFDEFTARNGRITGITTLFNLNATGIATITNLEASVTRLNTLNVSGISTFVGLTTFKSDVYVDGDLYVSDDLVFDEFTARNAIITGITTITGGLYYGPYYTNGMPYFNSSGLMVSTNSPQNGIDYTNYIMTTDNSNVPAWSNAIDGGTY